MNPGRRRIAFLALPLLAPWVLVTWDGGWYVVFSAFWVDPGPRFVTMPEFLWHARFAVASRNLAATWPIGLALYLAGLLVALLRPQRRVLVTSLFWLAGLMVLFYGVGIMSRSGLLAIPFGTAWLWLAAWMTYRQTGESSPLRGLFRQQ